VRKSNISSIDEALWLMVFIVLGWWCVWVMCLDIDIVIDVVLKYIERIMHYCVALLLLLVYDIVWMMMLCIPILKCEASNDILLCNTPWNAYEGVTAFIAWLARHAAKWNWLYHCGFNFINDRGVWPVLAWLMAYGTNGGAIISYWLWPWSKCGVNAWLT